MLTSSPSTSAPGTDKTGMDFRRILPEIRCQSCLSPGSEPTPRGDYSTLSPSRALAKHDRPRKAMVYPTLCRLVRHGDRDAGLGVRGADLHHHRDCATHRDPRRNLGVHLNHSRDRSGGAAPLIEPSLLSIAAACPVPEPFSVK